jgi:cytochrome c2
MTWSRKVVLTILAVATASTLMVAVVFWRQHYARQWWGSFMVGDPQMGVILFQKKSCAACHPLNHNGGQAGVPDLGFQNPPRSTLNQVVAAMWNHAPHMWDRMKSARVAYPQFDNQEMANLFAYLYVSRYVDEPGNEYHGRKLFESKGCSRCHAVAGEGGKVGPDLKAVGADTPIAWTQVMWNHAPAMEASMRQLGLTWPQFGPGEMNDLLAYVREVSGGTRREFRLLPADPDHGGKLFQQKACARCHALSANAAGVGPSLGPNRELPRSIVDFSGRIWNHAPEMMRVMKSQGITRPTFEGREMADVIAFLYGLNYFQSGGSPAGGRTLFTARGCSGCHGASGQGTTRGPELRKRGELFTSISLATSLWRHGPEMYERCKRQGIAWPTLGENDVADLVSFLNAPGEDKN